MPRLLPALLSAALAASAAATAEPTTSGDAPPLTELSVAYEKFELENGRDVILHRDRSDPIVALTTLVHV